MFWNLNLKLKMFHNSFHFEVLFIYDECHCGSDTSYVNGAFHSVMIHNSFYWYPCFHQFIVDVKSCTNSNLFFSLQAFYIWTLLAWHHIPPMANGNYELIFKPNFPLKLTFKIVNDDTVWTTKISEHPWSPIQLWTIL